MLDMSRCHLWAWDARPFPHFPGLTDVWTDGAYAMLGHWLSGRTGTLSIADLVSDVCHRSALMEVDVEGISGYADGFAIEAPTAARSLLENLFVVFGLEAVSRAHALVIQDGRDPVSDAAVFDGNITLRAGSLSLARTHHGASAPSQARFSCYASERDYQPTTQTSPASGQSGPVFDLASNLVLDPAARQHIANRLSTNASSDSLVVSLSPAWSARLEVGDRFACLDGAVWRVDRCEGQLNQTLSASRAAGTSTHELSYFPISIPAQPLVVSPPVFVVLDITAPYASSIAPKPLVGCASAVWAGDVEISIEGKTVGSVQRPMTYATTTGPVPARPVGRLIGSPLTLSVKFGAILPKTGQAALLLNGGVIDIISWRDAALIGPDLWRIGPWVRGLGGASAGVALPVDTPLVLLDDALVEVALDPALFGTSLNWQARPLLDTTIVTSQNTAFNQRALVPWPPCAPRAKRLATGIALTWTRRARGTGDAWAAINAPLGASVERYRVDILGASGDVVRTIFSFSPNCVYASGHQVSDFGGVQNQLSVLIRQIGDGDIQGAPLQVIVGVSG